MVKISVIVPVYNTERYLRQCLKSIVNQTIEDIEIICVNDGSTDRSPDILKEYEKADSRIKVISQKNMGLSSARNTGLKNATGDYIYFIDSDDYLKLTALEKLYKLSIDNNLDLLIFKLINFDEKTGEMDYTYSDMPFLLDIDKDIFTYDDFREDLFKVDVTVFTKFFKRSLIEDKRFAEGLIFEDNAFIFDYIFDAERIQFHDECLIYRRIRDNSIMTDGGKNHSDLIEIYRIIRQKFIKRNLYDEFREKLFTRKVDSIYYRFTLLNPEFKRQYYDLMKTDFQNQKNEYDNDFDLNCIPDYIKRIYSAVLKSEDYTEHMKNDNRQKEHKITSVLKKFKRKI